MVPTVIPGGLMENRELISALTGQKFHDGRGITGSGLTVDIAVSKACAM